MPLETVEQRCCKELVDKNIDVVICREQMTPVGELDIFGAFYELVFEVCF